MKINRIWRGMLAPGMVTMKARMVALGMALAVTGTAMAVPALRTFRSYTQPDGSQVTLQKVGDEHGHFFRTEDGRIVLENNNAYYFATLDAEGRLAASAVKAANASQRSAEQAAFVANIDNNRLLKAFSAKRAAAPRRAHEGLFPNESVQHTGSPHFLVILVEYKDIKFKTTGYPTNAQDYFVNMLSQEGFNELGGTGSAYDYFNENSLGKFTPSFDVYGPVTLNSNRSFYGGNDSYGNDKNPEKMVIEACQQLDDEVDFTQYDTDGDGEVDNVFIFYAGQGEASYGPTNSVWPHAWYVKDGAGVDLILDGVRINRYGCTNEWEESRPDGVGTFVHEFSHVLGLPDLYTTDYGSATDQTPGEYDALDYGPYNNEGRTPPYYSIFERNAMGWIDPEELIEGEGRSMTLNAISSHNEGFIINSPETYGSSTAEFFLLENRQQTGWDEFIPGHGMLIWHIDYNPSVWTANSPNNNKNHQYIDIEEANGKANNQNTATMATYTFPGTRRITSFDKFKNWRGTTLDYPITNIVEEDGVITFDICGGKPDDPDESSVSALIANHETPVVFNLQGMRIDPSVNLHPGIYIVNGKKVRFGPAH